jgi:hypothetical protein
MLLSGYVQIRADVQISEMTLGVNPIFYVGMHHSAEQYPIMTKNEQKACVYTVAAMSPLTACILWFVANKAKSSKAMLLIPALMVGIVLVHATITSMLDYKDAAQAVQQSR